MNDVLYGTIYNYYKAKSRIYSSYRDQMYELFISCYIFLLLLYLLIKSIIDFKKFIFLRISVLLYLKNIILK